MLRVQIHIKVNTIRLIIASPTCAKPVVNGPGRNIFILKQEVVVFGEENMLQLCGYNLSRGTSIYWNQSLIGKQRGDVFSCPFSNRGELLSYTSNSFHDSRGWTRHASHRDIRTKQATVMLEAGFLSCSIAYRLCLEASLLGGPMQDIRSALR